MFYQVREGEGVKKVQVTIVTKHQGVGSISDSYRKLPERETSDVDIV